jgi:hypothetical protein
MPNDFKLEATAQARVYALGTPSAELPSVAAQARETFRQELLAQARQLVQDAEAHGFVVTIERRSVEPLAMRNTVAAIEVREAR